MSQNGHFPPARVRGYPRLGVLWIRIRRIPGWYPPTHRQGTPGGKYPPQYSTTRGHVGWCWCVFRRFYVSVRGVYRRGLWTKGGLWTTTGYLSGSMGRILCSHEPTGPVCGCLTLFMFMKVSVNGRPLQFKVIWSSLGVRSYGPFCLDTADTPAGIHPPMIPHGRAVMGAVAVAAAAEQRHSSGRAPEQQQ